MIPDPLLDTSGPVDSLILERAHFHRRFFTWRESERHLVARYSWNSRGDLASWESEEGVELYAYDKQGRRVACYGLNGKGNLISREVYEWDDQSRLSRRVLKTVDAQEERIWTYEYDFDGQLRAEKQGRQIRVQKRGREGRLEQEYLYDGERPDLLTEYEYDEDGRVHTLTVKNPDGAVHRQTTFAWNSAGQLIAELVRDAEGRAVKDETYTYGVAQGMRWLERVSWVPSGKRRGNRRPGEVLYRSFGGSQIAPPMPAQMSMAFDNGVYQGPVRNGGPEGTGVFLYNDDSRYEGEFRRGTMEGRGRVIWPEGREMTGNFHQGFLEGRGCFTWPDGSRYEGEFHRGLMHGQGRFTWPDGTWFEGIFRDGEKTDQGTRGSGKPPQP